MIRMSSKLHLTLEEKIANQKFFIAKWDIAIHQYAGAILITSTERWQDQEKIIHIYAQTVYLEVPDNQFVIMSTFSLYHTTWSFD